MDEDGRSPGPAGPSSILRTGSSQSQQQRQPQTRKSASFAALPTTTSRQDSLNSILETAQERAAFMASASSRSSGRFEPLPHNSDQDDGPTETTSIVQGNSRDYHATRTSSNSIPSRRSTRLQEDDGHASGHEDEKTKWWKDYFASIWSIELENKGSVARDHLALERTFLAWLRTSLAFASIGIAITQLFRLNTSLSDEPEDPAFRRIRHLGKPLGATFLGISIVVLFLGYQRYFHSQKWIMKGKFPASRGTVVLVTLIALALMVVSLVVVVIVQPTGSHPEL